MTTLGVTASAAPRTFNDPTPTTGDFFGTSADLAGNNVLIGATGDDTNGTNVGQVHLFTISTLTADFDGDSDVDGGDFLKWQREGGTPGGIVDWHDQFGASSAGLSGQAVPEPTTWMLGMICLGLFSSTRR